MEEQRTDSVWINGFSDSMDSRARNLTEASRIN